MYGCWAWGEGSVNFVKVILNNWSESLIDNVDTKKVTTLPVSFDMQNILKFGVVEEVVHYEIFTRLVINKFIEKTFKQTS